MASLIAVWISLSITRRLPYVPTGIVQDAAPAEYPAAVTVKVLSIVVIEGTVIVATFVAGSYELTVPGLPFQVTVAGSAPLLNVTVVALVTLISVTLNVGVTIPPPPVEGGTTSVPVLLLFTVLPASTGVPPPPVTPVTLFPVLILVLGVSILLPSAPDWA